MRGVKTFNNSILTDRTYVNNRLIELKNVNGMGNRAGTIFEIIYGGTEENFETRITQRNWVDGVYNHYGVFAIT